MDREQLVLAFHGLGPAPDSIGDNERRYWCKTDQFRSLLDQIGSESQSAKIPIAITFDDGNMSDISIGMPALLERGLLATFFVCAGRIGQPGYLDAAAIRDLRDAGMRIGSHGWAHINWRTADDRTLDREVDQAREAIAEIVGRTVDEVAIPFGLYDRRVLRKLSSSGWKTVFTSDGGRAPLNEWMIPRETYDVTWDQETLEQSAKRRLPLIERLRRVAIRTVKRLR